MQFVEKGCCPEYLVKNKALWTSPWVDYYTWDKSLGTVKPKKPSDGHWRNDLIRIPLIQFFYNSCGYCGTAIPTSIRLDIGKGDVDHFLPKNIFPENTYEWENYIWSCKSCNQEKSAFYDNEYPLLNPCCKNDCSRLSFLKNTGQYVLNDKIKNDYYWQKRLKYTEKRTMINSSDICDARKREFSLILQVFKSISENIEAQSLLVLPEKNIAIDILNNHLEYDIQRLSTLVEDPPNFILLIFRLYEELLIEFPHVKNLLLDL